MGEWITICGYPYGNDIFFVDIFDEGSPERAHFHFRKIAVLLNGNKLILLAIFLSGAIFFASRKFEYFARNLKKKNFNNNSTCLETLFNFTKIPIP